MVAEISYNSKEEMMKITNANGKVLFHGNYWDFNRDPKVIYNLLIQLGVGVKLDNKLKPIG